MEPGAFIFIIAIFSVNLLLFYIIIQAATKSKQLAENSNAQLKILIELALSSGVSAKKIQSEIDLLKNNKIKSAAKDYNNGKITEEEYQKLNNQYTEEYQ